MLDLVFRNGQAPALNADNMNAIVNEINSNENDITALKNKVSTIISSEVIANPSSRPRYSLKTIEISGKVYAVEGGSDIKKLELIGTQNGTTEKTIELPKDAEQIIAMAYYDNHYYGTAKINLLTNLISELDVETETQLYEDYLGVLWNDNRTTKSDWYMNRNKFSDTVYKMYWNQGGNYGTIDIKLTDGSVIVNNSWSGNGVAIISDVPTGIIAPDPGIEKTEAEYLAIEQAGEEEKDAIYFITDKNYIVRNKIRYANKGGGSGSNIEQMTWAEYQALSNEEKHDGTARHITDKDGYETMIDDTISSDKKTWSSDKIKTSLNDKVDKWKYLSVTTGTNSISYSDLPSDASELLITGYLDQTNAQQRVYQTTISLAQLATNKLIILNLGGYIYSTTDFGYCDVNINPTNKTIFIRYLFDAGQNKNSSAGLVVRYR